MDNFFQDSDTNNYGYNQNNAFGTHQGENEKQTGGGANFDDFPDFDPNQKDADHDNSGVDSDGGYYEPKQESYPPKEDELWNNYNPTGTTKFDDAIKKNDTSSFGNNPFKTKTFKQPDFYNDDEYSNNNYFEKENQNTKNPFVKNPVEIPEVNKPVLNTNFDNQDYGQFNYQYAATAFQTSSQIPHSPENQVPKSPENKEKQSFPSYFDTVPAKVEVSEPKTSFFEPPKQIIREDPVKAAVQQSVSFKHEERSETKPNKREFTPPKTWRPPSENSSPGRVIDNEGHTLDIRCSIHKEEFIERICINPKYPKKKLLCWECGVDDSKEIQKYRSDVIPITKYSMQAIQEYLNRESSLPETLKNSFVNIDKSKQLYSKEMEEGFIQIQTTLTKIKENIANRLGEIEKKILDVGKEKMELLKLNDEYIKNTANTYYPQNTEKLSQTSLIMTLTGLENENDFDKFILSLKPSVNPDSQDFQNYFRLIHDKTANQNEKLPPKEHFVELEKKSAKLIQLLEQINANVDSIKSFVCDQFESSFNIEDITNTRVAKANNLTEDNISTLFSLNKLINENTRFRLTFEKKFSEPTCKSINCLAIIENDIIAAGTLDRKIHLWKISTSEYLETIAANEDVVSGLYTFKVANSDLKNRTPKASNFEEDSITTLISTGGKFDNNILIWDVSWAYNYTRGRIKERQSSTLVRRLEGQGSGITAVLPMLDGVTLISGCYDGKICVWNTLKSKLLGTINHHKSNVSALRFLRCKTRYASASWDKTICIWKITYKDISDKINDRKIFEGCELEKIIDPNFKVMALNASIHKKNWIVFGGSINRIIVWDIDSGRLIKEFEVENNNITEVLLVEDELENKMIVLGVCENDDVIRGWSTNYNETDLLNFESYNLKNRSKVYINKSYGNGSVMQLVQDGRLRLAAINCSEDQSLVSLFEAELGI